MTLYLAIFIYAAAMTLANLSVAMFGREVVPLNAFVLIGLDLALRDWLQVRLRQWQMAALIVGAGALTYVLNPGAGMIAVGSSVAFMSAALVDWAVFTNLSGSYLRRSLWSNVPAAVVDSLVFPLLAFGGLDWKLVTLMVAAKVLGGGLWSLALERLSRRTA